MLLDGPDVQWVHELSRVIFPKKHGVSLSDVRIPTHVVPFFARGFRQFQQICSYDDRACYPRARTVLLVTIFSASEQFDRAFRQLGVFVSTLRRWGSPTVKHGASAKGEACTEEYSVRWKRKRYAVAFSMRSSPFEVLTKPCLPADKTVCLSKR